MTSSKRAGYRRSTLQHALILLLGLSLTACAGLGQKSNADRMTATTGKSFVISVPAAKLDLNLITGEKRSDLSILRLVDEQNYKFAFQSNGNRLSGPLSVNDPSVNILNALNKYYQKQNQIKFVAKGTINNIDEQFLAGALNKGDYLIDVRVSELALKRKEDTPLFYLQAAYQFTVFDRKKGKYLLQDQCRFAEPDKAQTVRAFSNQNGAPVADFLNRYASACLNYFVSGKALPVQQSVTTPKPAPPKKTSPVQASSSSIARISLGTDYHYYPNYPGDAKSLISGEFTVGLGKSLSPTMGWMVQGGAKVAADDAFPTFAQGTIYAANLGVGANLYPNGNVQNGYSLMLNGQIGQFRQNAIALSTNAIGLNIGAYRQLIGPLQAQVRYTYWLHVGKTKEANLGGHALGVGLGLQF